MMIGTTQKRRSKLHWSWLVYTLSRHTGEWDLGAVRICHLLLIVDIHELRTDPISSPGLVKALRRYAQDAVDAYYLSLDDMKDFWTPGEVGCETIVSSLGNRPSPALIEYHEKYRAITNAKVLADQNDVEMRFWGSLGFERMGLYIHLLGTSKRVEGSEKGFDEMIIEQ
jgi:hypothetical protein